MFNRLHEYSATGNEEGVKKVLIERDDFKILNKYNRFGMTSLHGAAFHGHSKIIKILLENGADPNLPSFSHKFTFPLHLAVEKLNFDCIRELFNSPKIRLDYSLRDYRGLTAVDICKQEITIEKDSIVRKNSSSSKKVLDLIQELIEKERIKSKEEKIEFNFASGSKIKRSEDDLKFFIDQDEKIFYYFSEDEDFNFSFKENIKKSTFELI
jgi:hypothetical protein